MELHESETAGERLMEVAGCCYILVIVLVATDRKARLLTCKIKAVPYLRKQRAAKDASFTLRMNLLHFFFFSWR